MASDPDLSEVSSISDVQDPFFYHKKLYYYFNKEYQDKSIQHGCFSPINFEIEFNWKNITVSSNENEVYLMFSKQMAIVAKLIFKKLSRIFVYEVPVCFLKLISLQVLGKYNNVHIVWSHLKNMKFAKLNKFKIEIDYLSDKIKNKFHYRSQTLHKLKLFPNEEQYPQYTFKERMQMEKLSLQSNFSYKKNQLVIKQKFDDFKSKN
ncbi:hypothetical protein BLOT_016847 [Blomia tropicalis]|nr:hypothetical protein BLOT_016847 [Blomia tropicalis]